MNFPLTDLLPAARGTVAAPKLSVTILYECMDSGEQAKRFTDQFADVEAANRAFDLNLWSFGVPGMRQTRNDSVGTAAAADLVILSMSGKNPLPAQVEEWIEMWTWLIDGHKPAVVVLFAASDTNGVRIRAYLRRAANGCANGLHQSALGQIGPYLPRDRPALLRNLLVGPGPTRQNEAGLAVAGKLAGWTKLFLPPLIWLGC